MTSLNREQLIEAHRNRTIAWLGKKAPQGMSCPVCSKMSWNIGEMVELRPFHGGALIIGGESGTYPAMQVVCNNCAYTMLINAVSSGILTQYDYPTDGSENG